MVDGAPLQAPLRDRPAMFITGQPGPRYPQELRSAKIEGRVTAMFIIDTTGTADLSTFKETSSTHALFTAAVKEGLPGIRFLPGEVNGRKVRVWIEQTFEFKLAK